MRAGDELAQGEPHNAKSQGEPHNVSQWKRGITSCQTTYKKQLTSSRAGEMRGLRVFGRNNCHAFNIEPKSSCRPSAG